MRHKFLANDSALDFINTAFARGDTMPDFTAFVAWLAEARMLTEAEAEAAQASATELERRDAARGAHALRSAVRRSVDAFVRGERPDAEDLALVNARLLYAPMQDQLVATARGLTTLRHVNTDAADALLYFPADAARKLLTEKDPRSIRRCANEACTHYFYDASKNGTRRWCSMAVCGNRLKVATLRKRRREG